MPRQKEFTFKKGYEKSGLKGQKITWTNGTTIDEALAPNPTHPENQPDFPSAEVLLAYAYAQLDIRRGHAVKAELDAALEGDAEKGVAPRDLTLAEAEAIARKTTASSKIRGRSGVTAKAKQVAEMTKADSLAQHDEEKLAALVTLGLITIEQANAERLRRAVATGGETQGKRRPAGAR